MSLRCGQRLKRYSHFDFSVMKIYKQTGSTLVKTFHLPDYFFGLDLPSRMPLNDAKVWVRSWLKVDRLPRGTVFCEY